MSDDQKQTATPASENEPNFEKRWGKDVYATGYLIVPSLILRAQSRLHLDCVDLAVLLHLIDHWWYDGKMPFPSKRLLSERIGKSEKTIQRALGRLEAEDLIKRIKRYNKTGGQTSNTYDLKPLVRKLKPIAKDVLEANSEAKETSRSPEKSGHRLRREVKQNA